MTTIDKNEKFLINHLMQADTSNHSVITGLGITTSRVSDPELLEGISKAFDNAEVEAEFSYIKNKHLHYTPKMRSGVHSDGFLTIRVKDKIFQFNVISRYDDRLFIVSFHLLDFGFTTTNVNERLNKSEKLTFIDFLILRMMIIYNSYDSSVDWNHFK